MGGAWDIGRDRSSKSQIAPCPIRQYLNNKFEVPRGCVFLLGRHPDRPSTASANGRNRKTHS